jgi:hypothetical protein
MIDRSSTSFALSTRSKKQAMKLNEIADNSGSRKKRMRVGRGIGSGKGKTGRSWRQGPDRAFGRPHQGLRRRPDAAASPSAEARLQQHLRARPDGVNLVCRKPSMPRSSMPVRP